MPETLPYRLTRPARLTTSVIFASPHSGRDYPQALLERTGLDEARLRSSEDAFVEDLLQRAPQEGAALLAARLPRAWVDLNRAADELDPALIEGLGRRAPVSPRVAAGLGVIPRVVASGRAIYAGKISCAEAQARIDAVWRPYHAALAELIEEVRGQFGRAILIDMHSMPSEALDAFGVQRPDIVLGDRHGNTARASTVAAVEAVLRGLGLRVARNRPFAGAYIAQRYGRPAEGVEVIQLEICRSLYMDERLVRRAPQFDAFAGVMGRAVAQIAELGRAQGRIAAE
ncbi:N-formylglutamate amidohydrolase [Sedimentimonas flavescens]|uniref:N-formylglutamate amidohydrolase n=1 Tax=Sedimentimonas flavescens TaxID=2851012 RepID=A0ABT2ZZQ6_9RHOB|nr:N-formylglutamate amidohydrolase [Sedimentimonas flavescens]MCT2540901.1 N-formylglutamate amidohydrolase [Sedimentimonas flavescens]MCV2879241.1 N-formylglutamate amidohydrolase [Sedimentimonas flavescens]WBL32909.1 N-formylglutamate amidohydrolase [Sinirhodobacter sp. HNIBRBA609]